MKIYLSTFIALLLAERSDAFAANNPLLWGVRNLFQEATPSNDGFDVSVPYDAPARLAYDEWRAQFKKGAFDEKRYQIFKTNYETISIANVSAKKKAREEGITSLTLMSLNEFGDMTETEYKKAISSGSKKMSTVDVLNKAVENAELQSEASTALGEAADALAEEERKLAQSLGLNSVDELEVALDSMDGIAPDGGELDSENISREARVRDAYLKWCKEFRKKPDESRYPTFANNFLLMEQYAKESNKEMNLNQFADCTKAEYEAILESQAAKKAELEAERAKIAQAVVDAKEKEEAEREAQRKLEEQAEKEAAAARAARSKELAERAKLEAERRKQIEQERAERVKQQEAALAKQRADIEQSIIAAAKADAELQARLAKQRAAVEAQAATLARQQALEWEEKQRRVAEISATGGMAIPKKVEKKPTSFFGFMQSDKVAPKQSSPPKTVAAPKKVVTPPKSQQKIPVSVPKTVDAPSSVFSFFTTPTSAAPKKSTPSPPKPSITAPPKETEQPMFSFFNMPATVPKKEVPITPKPSPAAVSSKTEQPSFNFFNTRVPEPKKVITQPSKPASTVTTSTPEKMFSFFSSSVKDTPVKAPEKAVEKSPPSTMASASNKEMSTPPSNPFSFFDGPKKSMSFNIIATTPKPAPKVEASKMDTPVPNRSGTINLFGSGTPKKDIPVPNRAGTLSVKSASKNANKVSIPNRPGTISIRQPTASKGVPAKSLPKPSPTISLFGAKPTASPPDKVLPPKVLAESTTKPFSFFGSAKPPSTSGTKSIIVSKSVNVLKASPAKTTSEPSKPFSFFGSSTSASKSVSISKSVTVSKSVSIPKKPSQPSKSSPILGNKNPPTSAKSPPKDVPILSQWKQNADGSITGKVSNSPNYRPGTQITTSPVPKGAKAGSLVKTGSGSRYFLR